MAVSIAGSLLETFSAALFTVYFNGKINCTVPPYKKRVGSRRIFSACKMNAKAKESQRRFSGADSKIADFEPILN